MDFPSELQDWQRELASTFDAPAWQKTSAFVDQAYATGKVYPPREAIFTAFQLTPFHAVKVVIIGQDPYHEEGEAMGLAFAVPKTVKTPPSLRNIAKELRTDSVNAPADEKALPDLVSWAEQGVLLLNATLTVAAGQAGSHAKCGWQQWTDEVIRRLSAEKEGLVFVLWGKFAEKKRELIDEARHHVIISAHPSPLSASRGFFGSKPFSKINAYLVQHGREPIDWWRGVGAQ